jgi:small subunit ribosomal protein S8
MLHDPIADLLTRVRNASMAKHRYVEVQHSKLKEAIIKVLKEKGFIAYYLVKEEDKKVKMRIFLKYAKEREPVISGLKRMSTPSLRRYVSKNDIPRVFGGLGIAIVSTPKGLMDGEQARAAGVGGELIALAW